VERFGRIDVLVNNAGIERPMPTIDMTQEIVDAVVNTNFRGYFFGCQRAARDMLQRGKGGSIINISSIAATTPDISQVAYGTSKAAIDQMTKLTAVQAGQYNIRCNAVLPGMTATDAVKDNLSDTFRDIFLKQTPLKRMAKPEEIAAAVAYFASDDAAFVTGQILEVAGGFGLGTPVYGDLMAAGMKR